MIFTKLDLYQISNYILADKKLTCFFHPYSSYCIKNLNK